MASDPYVTSNGVIPWIGHVNRRGKAKVSFTAINTADEMQRHVRLIITTPPHCHQTLIFCLGMLILKRTSDGSVLEVDTVHGKTLNECTLMTTKMNLARPVLGEKTSRINLMSIAHIAWKFQNFLHIPRDAPDWCSTLMGATARERVVVTTDSRTIL